MCKFTGISSHHKLRNFSFQIKVTVSGFLFLPLPHITLMMQLLKLPDNLWNILHTDISNGIPCTFIFIWPYNGLETQKCNQPLSWSSQIIFWLWRCDFHLVQTTKFQRDVQGDILFTILIYLCFLTLRRSQFFMFTGVKSPSVKFSSQNVFQVEQPW